MTQEAADQLAAEKAKIAKIVAERERKEAAEAKKSEQAASESANLGACEHFPVSLFKRKEDNRGFSSTPKGQKALIGIGFIVFK